MRNLSSDTFRLVWYESLSDNKFANDWRHEYLGSRDAIFRLWSLLKQCEYKHIEIYDLTGGLQNPLAGVDGVVGFNV